LTALALVTPRLEHLPGYVAALERGWHADNTRGADAIAEDLEAIERDAAQFVALQTDIEARGPGFTLPDGTVTPGYPDIAAGCGMANSAERSAFAGRTARTSFRPRAWPHRLTRSCRGSAAAATPPWRSA
jgi:hypothetical protein